LLCNESSSIRLYVYAIPTRRSSDLFDGDAVLFSDESEQVFQREGLAAFQASELAAARQPLGGGPFKAFLAALNRIQTEFSTTDRSEEHTSELQSRENLVCRLLLEKK